MPDEKSGGSDEKEAQQEIPKAKPISPAPSFPPPSPSRKDTKSVGKRDVSQEVGALGDRIRAAEIWMICLTAAIAVFALGSVIVGFLQWNVMSGQLREMNRGGADTHNLAVAAGEQATWTQRLANNAGDQLLIMKNQLSEMRAEQRPWVYADIKPNGAVYRTQSGGFGFPFAFILQNTGHIPAQSALPYFGVHTSRWLYNHHQTIAQEQQNSCQRGLSKFRTDKERTGSTVFPNHPQAIGEVAAVSQPDWDSGRLPGTKGDGAEVEVAGCVVYSYGNKIGTTGFAFSFAWSKGRQPPFNTFIFPRNPTAVPANQIVIVAWPAASVWRAH